MDIISLQIIIYGSNIRKTLQTLQKLLLRLITLQLFITYKPSYITKVYRLIRELLLYSLYIIYYIKRTKWNRLKRKFWTILILIDSLPYCCCRNIVNLYRSKPTYPPLILKLYTPYSPTNIALQFINRSLFYSSILAL